MTKPTPKEIYDRMSKIVKWTCKAEEATTRKQAQKALRKIAKHSLKLEQLQAKSYNEITEQEDT